MSYPPAPPLHPAYGGPLPAEPRRCRTIFDNGEEFVRCLAVAVWSYKGGFLELCDAHGPSWEVWERRRALPGAKLADAGTQLDLFGEVVPVPLWMPLAGAE